MTDKNESRRKWLKSLAAGSGAVVAGKSLPESWSKPVIDSVILPVHAETTTEDLPEEQICCEGIVCNLVFTEAGIGGDAELSNCIITFKGETRNFHSWGGSGAIATDGTFSFNVVFTPAQGTAYNETISGMVSVDCLSISGSVTNLADFTGKITPPSEQCVD